MATNRLPLLSSSIWARYSVTRLEISISNTWRDSKPTCRYCPVGSPLRSTFITSISSGSSTFLRVVPTCPFWPPGFLPVFLFACFFLFGSLDGGLLLLVLFKFKRLTSKVMIRMRISNIDFVAVDNCLSSRTRICAFSIVARMSMFSIFTGGLVVVPMSSIKTTIAQVLKPDFFLLKSILLGYNC